MAQLVDADERTVPVMSRKMREPSPNLWNWDKYQEMGLKEGEAIWVTMTTKGKLDEAGIERYALTQTVDGWEYLVRKSDLIRHLRIVTPPFKVM